jgi:hypothetical protein
VVELKLAGAADREAANAVLARFVARFNRRFAVPAANPVEAWAAAPRPAALEAICCLKYRRVVAHDNTVRAGATILQLPARSGNRSLARRRVELQLRLDGRLVVWDGGRVLLATQAPADPVQLRALGAAPRGGGHAGAQPRFDQPAKADPSLAAGRGRKQALRAATVRITEQLI